MVRREAKLFAPPERRSEMECDVDIELRSLTLATDYVLALGVPVNPVFGLDFR